MLTVSDVVLERLLTSFAEIDQFAFFDTARADDENQTSYLFLRPVERLQCGGDDDPGRFLAQVQRRLASGHYVAGWFSYEFGVMLIGGHHGSKNKPFGVTEKLADLGVYERPFTFDHQSGRCDFPLAGSRQLGECQVTGISANMEEDEYVEALERVLEYIRAGDTYQVNYTFKLLFSLLGSHEALYRTLRRNQSVPYGAYIRWGSERVMSFSPEMFFRKHHQGITVRPMKGTAKRGRNGAEDEAACSFLYHDQKNRSENVMIVDLLRNDLGRVVHQLGEGEVRVRSLFDVEIYESLLQMTSTIDAVIEDERWDRLSLTTLFGALFPCGSITGAPKIRTMEIIDELEKGARGVYTGAIGFLTPAGDGVFNVPIRTLTFAGQQGEMGVGSGITHDSDPRDEWQECVLKSRFLTDPSPEFHLVETMLWEPGSGLWLGREHFQRLTASARYFGFPCDPDELAREVETHLTAVVEPRRVRLTVAGDGEIKIESQSCGLPRCRRLPVSPGQQPYDLPRIAFAAQATDMWSPWLQHKTSRRQLYLAGMAWARQEGLFDVLYLNERGEVTEGAIANVVIYRHGRYRTPPVSCGLLPGVMRGHLLADHAVQVVEEVLHPEDIHAAEAVFMVNSVRGVTRVAMRDVGEVTP
ncbi:MAG: aminodeoxychorismate synthase component I [Desulfopila sp.]